MKKERKKEGTNERTNERERGKRRSRSLLSSSRARSGRRFFLVNEEPRRNGRTNGGTGFPWLDSQKSNTRSNPIDLEVPKGAHSKRAEEKIRDIRTTTSVSTANTYGPETQGKRNFCVWILGMKRRKEGRKEGSVPFESLCR
jgi:hypothetical protein